MIDLRSLTEKNNTGKMVLKTNQWIWFCKIKEIEPNKYDREVLEFWLVKEIDENKKEVHIQKSLSTLTGILSFDTLKTSMRWW